MLELCRHRLIYLTRPLIGGSLSDAAQKYPELFGTYFFEYFPYFLPCFVVACATLVAALIGFVFLEEVSIVFCKVKCNPCSSIVCKTLPSKKLRSQLRREYSITYGIAEHNDREIDTVKEESSTTASSLLRLPVLRALCISGCALSFVGSAFDVVFVLFCYSPIKSGGLAFSVSRSLPRLLKTDSYPPTRSLRLVMRSPSL